MYFRHTEKLRNRPLPRVVHMDGSMPRLSTNPVPKNTPRKTAAAPAAGTKSRHGKGLFFSFGRKDRASSTAANTPMVSHCMESGR